MTTKQMYDNGYLLPTQNISALKEAIAIQKGLAAFLPSAVTEQPTSSKTASRAPAPKVFTGIISQGTLGAKTEFFARPDDIIDSIDDLRVALQNNLTPFLATVTGRILYEIKIVSHVVSKDGSVQTGTTQTITTGTRKDGSAITKTLTNKFAVVYLYFLTDKGVRAKISTIVLGPTDALKFRPNDATLASIEGSIKNLVLTNNTKEITNIATNAQPVAVPTAPAVSSPITPSPQVMVPVAPTAQPFVATTTPAAAPAAPIILEPPKTIAPAALPPAKLGANASTLYEWYTTRGQSLPSVSERSFIYQSFGLGPASLYVGSAEQNTKLLAELKTRA